MRKFTSFLMLLVFAVTATVQAQNATDEQPLTIVDITPAVGEVESLSEIIVTFSEDVAPNKKMWYLDKTTEFSTNYITFNYVDDPELPANQLKFVTATPVTEPCTCLLYGSDINVKYGDSKTKNFSGINYTWVVSEAATGIETRATILGYMQRGGSPTCKDRYFASIMGAYATDLLCQGKSNRVVCYQKGEFVDYDIETK